MTKGQYRALVAYLNYWPKLYARLDLAHAMKDIGISDSREDVIAQLDKAGHEYDETTGVLRYVFDDDDSDGVAE